MKHDALKEPCAVRYDFDGYGFKYIDSGSGSDWLTRQLDGEPLYDAQAITDLEAEIERLEQMVLTQAQEAAKAQKYYSGRIEQLEKHAVAMSAAISRHNGADLHSLAAMQDFINSEAGRQALKEKQ